MLILLPILCFLLILSFISKHKPAVTLMPSGEGVAAETDGSAHTEWCNQSKSQFSNGGEQWLGAQRAHIDNGSYHRAKELPHCSLIISRDCNAWPRIEPSRRDCWCIMVPFIPLHFPVPSVNDTLAPQPVWSIAITANTVAVQYK